MYKKIATLEEIIEIEKEHPNTQTDGMDDFLYVLLLPVSGHGGISIAVLVSMIMLINLKISLFDGPGLSKDQDDVYQELIEPQNLNLRENSLFKDFEDTKVFNFISYENLMYSLMILCVISTVVIRSGEIDANNSSDEDSVHKWERSNAPFVFIMGLTQLLMAVPTLIRSASQLSCSLDESLNKDDRSLLKAYAFIDSVSLIQLLCSINSFIDFSTIVNHWDSEIPDDSSEFMAFKFTMSSIILPAMLLQAAFRYGVEMRQLNLFANNAKQDLEVQGDHEFKSSSLSSDAKHWFYLYGKNIVTAINPFVCQLLHCNQSESS
ncbi:hypothetical protein DID77_02590 [Candidatus Marinamargulisbacteria bacterium SCGC AG-439-L15]|nr:hypothetical protein DID77_02590 [Candidatus Marinamargulisbacteria bacterium SCGC AG-439-L15]